MTKQKTYCVHVHMRPYQYGDVKAISAIEAEAKVVKREFNGDYEEIQLIETFIRCKGCGYDNDLKNKKCDNCEIKL